MAGQIVTAEAIKERILEAEQRRAERDSTIYRQSRAN